MSVLFDSVKIGSMTLRNRFVRSATYDGCAERNGHVSQYQLKMYEDLARGGVGLIITGITYVHPSAQISPFQNSLAGDDGIPGFRRLVQTVHQQGAKIAVQLFHAGRETAKVFRPELKQAIAPSLVTDDPNFQAPHRAMTEEEIWEIVKAFGDASRRARRRSTPCSPRLSIEPIPFSLYQPPQRPLGWESGEPLAPSPRNIPGHAGGGGSRLSCACKNRGSRHVSRWPGIP
jgi:hypothetical protein